MPRNSFRAGLPAIILVTISLVAFLGLDFLQWKQKQPGSIVFSWLLKVRKEAPPPVSLEKEVLPLIRKQAGPTLRIAEIREKPRSEVRIEAEAETYAGLFPQLKKQFESKGFKVEISLLEEDEKKSVFDWSLEDKKQRRVRLLFQVSKPILAQAPPVLPAKKPAPPEKPLREKKVAIIIDDLGNDLDSIRAIIALSRPITISILPQAVYAQETAAIASSHGLEVMLHLPMESVNSQENNGFSGSEINSRMSPEEVLQTVRGYLEVLPGARGVNNHRGSLITQDRDIMRIILTELAARNLFFIDSRTTDKSIAYSLAREMGLRTGKRDIFLDADQDKGSIAKRVKELIGLGQRNGSAIAIGHPYPETLGYLAKALYQIENSGIKLVSVSQIIQ